MEKGKFQTIEPYPSKEIKNLEEKIDTSLLPKPRLIIMKLEIRIKNGVNFGAIGDKFNLN